MKPWNRMLASQILPTWKNAYQLQHLLSVPISNPLRPIGSREVVPECQNIQLEELIPVPTESDSVVQATVLGNDTKVKPTSTVHGLITGIIPDRATAYLYSNLLFRLLGILIFTKVD
jgi:hypothetical protein